MNSKIKQALISVSDKQGIVEFVKELIARNVKILSTGGTAKLLLKAGIAVTEVSEYIQFPEIMDGRVKTLHPKIHAGILGRRNIDTEIMQQHNIESIDMVVVNLYPFATTVVKPDCSMEDAIENIDIGGPAMIRSAAKNHKYVAVVVNHNDYNKIIDEMDQYQNSLTLNTKFDLAVKAFEHTAEYDGMIANYFGQKVSPYYGADEKELSTECGKFSRTLNFSFTRKEQLRYGENSHQEAALYIEKNFTDASIINAKQLHGKALSYNNIADADAAFECAKEFTRPACVIVKHANPCGVAIANNVLEAYIKAYQTDPTSAFGGIIAFNSTLDKKTAAQIIQQQFVEVIIAPKIENDALDIIKTKKFVRVLETGSANNSMSAFDIKKIKGGILVQDYDIDTLTIDDVEVVSNRQPTAIELQDMLFSWKVAKYVKSNAIVYAKNNQTIGIGAGQMSRVYSAKIAGIKAQECNLIVAGAMMASDAFLPFRDGVDAAAEIGIIGIIQPGGSIRDNEVIEAVNEHNMVMVFTKIRHFKH